MYAIELNEWHGDLKLPGQLNGKKNNHQLANWQSNVWLYRILFLLIENKLCEKRCYFFSL